MEAKCPIRFHASPLPCAWGDENLMRHIFNNLLTNAVKYSPAAGAVGFTIERSNGDALFRVQDRGLGIPAADQKQLFTVFHRGQNVTQVPGTGLGLVIVKRCVELHGGQITWQSAEGEGTTFSVTLPVFGREATGAHKPV
jgi:signal transduction histidine kinase